MGKSISGVVLVGERQNGPARKPPCWPDTSGDEYLAWSLAAGAFRDLGSRRKLASIGVRVGEVRTLNLLPPDPQGVPWDARAAREVAGAWAGWLAGRDLVLLAGGRVARAFGLGGPYSPTFGEVQWIFGGGARAVVLPHPSGLNLWWNDPFRVRELGACLERVMATAGSGRSSRRSGPTSSPAGSPSA